MRHNKTQFILKKLSENVLIYCVKFMFRFSFMYVKYTLQLRFGKSKNISF